MKNLQFVLAVFLISSKVIFSQSTTPDPDFWIADGPSTEVRSICEYGGYTYLGGYFTFVGKRTGYGMKVNTGNSNIDYGFPEVNGSISSVVSDGEGGWYIGGSFTKVGNVTRNNLARIDADGNVMGWNPDANNVVECLFFDGNHVYVGGQFTNVGGANRTRIAKLDNTFGIADPLWIASAGNTVYSIFVDNSSVFIGGTFNGIDFVTRNRIAKLDKSNGDLDPDWIPNANNTVHSISASLDMSGIATAIYAGGSFTIIGKNPESRSRIAKLDNVEGDVDGSWSADANGTVWVVEIGEGYVFAGGDFTTIKGESRSKLAKLNNINGNVDVNFNPGANSRVRDLAIYGSFIYVAGEFLNIGGLERSFLAKLDKFNGNVDFNWKAGVGTYVFSIGISGSNLYAGGNFKAGGEIGIGGARRNGLARINNSTGELDFNWYPHPNGAGIQAGIQCVEAKDGYLYVGGYFDTIANVVVRNLAKIDITTGIPEAGWTPNPNSPVYDIIFIGNEIIVAGAFTGIGGYSRYQLAKLDNSTGTVDADWNPSPNQVVNCIATNGTYIYAGGDFTNIGGQTRNRIAKLDNDFGNAVNGDGWEQGANNTVDAIAVLGNDVYAGGQFTTIGGLTKNRLAKLQSSDGYAYVSWNPNVNWTVRNIKLHGDKMYVGGLFSSIGGFSRYGIARLDLGTGIPDSWYPGLNGGAYEIEFTRTGHLIIIGGFSIIGGTPLYTSPAVFRTDDPIAWWKIKVDKRLKYGLAIYEVRNSSSPYNLVSSANSIGGEGLEIPTYLPDVVDNTPYYIVVKTTNTIETWSNPVSFTDGILEYDFTSAITQAYGSNMTLEDGLWSFYTGDPNQDGVVDLSDVSLINNDAINYVSGVVPADLNGDEVVDITDVLFGYNNSINFIAAVTP